MKNYVEMLFFSTVNRRKRKIYKNYEMAPMIEQVMKYWK